MDKVELEEKRGWDRGMRGQKREEPAEVSQAKVLVEGSSCLQFPLVMVASGSGLMFLFSAVDVAKFRFRCLSVKLRI